MAIDNLFEFAAPGVSVEVICEAIELEFESELERDFFEPKAMHGFYNDNIAFGIRKIPDILNENSERMRNYDLKIHKELYKFTPDYSILFHWNKRDILEFEILQTKIINFILREFSSDAFYRANIDTPRLWQYQGKLYLDKTDGCWTRDNGYTVTHLFDMPFEWIKLPEMPQ